MPENRSHAQQRPSAAPREFFLPIEVYISNQAAAALRKPNPRKRAEKRESSRPLSMLGDDNQRKVKEKTSWLSLASRPTTGDQWRQATCCITEEEEGCVLKVYLQETILFQSVYLHLLFHTDIRPADQSLFFRKDCLGIHCSANQRWSATHSREPLYFAFPSTEAMNTWMALFRSYATPEVYGKSRTHWGGTYRLWRQVELTCIQGRNIGVPRTLDSAFSPGAGGDQEGRSDVDAVDLDLFCEVYVNSVLSGRTVVKKSMGSPDWHQTFQFADLPPFEKLAIVVWREKKLQKPFVIGTVYITLTNFRRGEHVEGWFPVLLGGATTPCTQVGQLRLKLKVDEEIVLPYSKYSKVVDTLDQRNYLDWMVDLDTKFKIREASGPLISIAIAKKILLSNVFEMADREVEETTSSHHTLFRGNTVLTKTIESLMGWYGKSFLEASVGVTIRRLCLDNVAIEVDPVRNTKGSKDIERNVDLLVYWCREIWEQIYSVRQRCPDEMRELFKYIRQLVEKRYSKGFNTDTNDLPRQSVSAFCFLRFIVPAILHPHLFGLCSGLPDLPVQRSLTLIAKVIQSLANLNTTVHKEQFMRGVKSFLEEKLPEMLDYILTVSTPRSEESSQPSEPRNRSRAVRALDERKQTMPDLQKELISHEHHFLDIPRHLALITSAIVRHSRHTPPPQDAAIADLYNRCREVERHALHYVTRHRGGGAGAARLLPASPEPSNSPATSSHSPVDAPQPLSLPKSRPSSSRSRPKTAPSGAMSDPALHTRVESTDLQGLPLSPPLGLATTSAAEAETEAEPSKEDESWSTLRRQASHPRSVSTDSIPTFRDAAAGGAVKALVEAVRPQKKGFLRNILSRK